MEYLNLANKLVKEALEKSRQEADDREQVRPGGGTIALQLGRSNRSIFL